MPSENQPNAGAFFTFFEAGICLDSDRVLLYFGTRSFVRRNSDLVKNNKNGGNGEMGEKIITSAFCAMLAVVFSSTHAANFSYTGTFIWDNDVQLFNFTADGISTVELRTLGYGGGMLDDGTLVEPGGFNPMITVFDSTEIIAVVFDGSTPPDENDSTGLALDALYKSVLAAGTYTVALTLYGNFAMGDNPADGFFFESEPTFSTFFEINASCGNGQFCSYDAGGDPVDRTSAWALDILNVESASMVPVPAAVWLFGSGLFGLIALARRNRV